MPRDTLMLELARFIKEHCEEKLSLHRLAKEMLLSSTHLQKRFKAQIGVSPKEYQDACRLKKLKRNLRTKKSITESIYETGHASSSRVYEKLNQRIGMTPKAYQRNGLGVEISYTTGKTPLGKILMAATDRGICFIQFGETVDGMLEALVDEFPLAHITQMPKTSKLQFKLWLEALNDYVRGNIAKLDLPLDIKGTAFQLKVWKYLQQIPRGETLSYTELAHKIGHPRAVRAVASACAQNNLAIVIPCHRVLRGSGELAGYRWGLERKRKLLELEKGQ